MRSAILGSIVGRESRVCACGVRVEHLVIRYAVRSAPGAIAQGTVYQPRLHRAPCGRACARGLPRGEAPTLERHHLEGCQRCAVELMPESRVCPSCSAWMEGFHSCPEPYVCRECGAETCARVAPVVRAKMEAERLCHLCQFWWEKLEIRSAPTAVRAAGCHYILGDEDPRIPTAARGYGGQTAVVTFRDGRRVVSSNVWYQGVIPEHFRGRLPDNAVIEWTAQRGATP